MIINHEYLNGKLILSYIDKDGNLKFKNYNWQNPKQWVVTHDRDPEKSDFYRTWDKNPVKQINIRYPNRYSVYEYLLHLPEEERQEIFAYNEPKTYFCDIEVEITEGFPEAHVANNRVTAICMIYESKILLLGIKDFTEKEISKMEKDINEHFKKFNTEYKIKWEMFDSEYDMLHYFFNDLIKIIPVLTGWNFVGYDWVYLVTRARKIGINPNVASPTGKLIKPFKKNENAQKPTFEELPKHRLIFDYMDIFSKWDQSIKIKESETLDFTAGEVLGLKKLEYKGTLKDLYTNDYYKYMLYNCVDTALVQQIHKKQRTFDIMLAISNMSNIPIEDSVSAIRVTEGMLFESYYKQGIIMCKQKNTVLDNGEEEIEEETELTGGYVKYPSTGLKQWVTVFDFASLYPTTMRQFNISPEAFKGMKVNDTNYCLLNGKQYEIEDTDIVLLNGAVFNNKDSETKKIITEKFIERKKNKNIGLDFKKQTQLLKEFYKKKFDKEYT